MLIVYCDACGLRILQKDFDSGGVVQVDENKYFCAKCAPAQAPAPAAKPGRPPSSMNPAPTPSASSETGVMRSPTGETRRASGEARTSKTTMRMANRSSSTGIAPVTRASVSGSRNIPQGAPAPATESRKMALPLIAGGVGVLVLGIGLYTAFSGKSPTPEKAVALAEEKPGSEMPAPPKPEAAKKAEDKPADEADERRRALRIREGADSGGAQQVSRGAPAETAKTGSVDLRKNVTPALATLGAPAAEAQKTVNGEIVFCDDGLPPGAMADGTMKATSWKWVSAPDPVFSGTHAHTHNMEPADAVQQHYFTTAAQGLKVHPDDILFAYVYLDAKNPPKTVMLQWNFHDSWDHRAYWGEDDIPFGKNFSATRLPMGSLPKVGEWVRLEVPAAQIGVQSEEWITGLSFDTFGGRCYWDKAGVKPMPKSAVAEKTPPPEPEKVKPAEMPATAMTLAGDYVSLAKVIAHDMQGGQEFNNFLGKTVISRAIWAKPTPLNALSSKFTVPDGRYGEGMLIVNTLRHDRAEGCKVAFQINGTEFFSAADPAKDGKAFYDHKFPIPAGLLRSGVNEFKILCTEESGRVGAPPWYMVQYAEFFATPMHDFAPIVSEAQRAKLQNYDRALEALVKKDTEVLLKLDGVLRLIKPVAAENVFAANESKEKGGSTPLLTAVERARELHALALDSFRKKPPTEPISVEKMKMKGTISRVDGSKVFIKSGGIELSVDIANLPQNLFYKALAIDESKPAGLGDKAAYWLGLGELDETQAILKKIKPENRPAWAEFFSDYAGLERVMKFETQATTLQQSLAHGKTDTAVVVLNGLKKDYADLIELNKERFEYLSKRVDAIKK